QGLSLARRMEIPTSSFEARGILHVHHAPHLARPRPRSHFPEWEKDTTERHAKLQPLRRSSSTSATM
ncbi:hypothetical protein K523DRAFT_256120, partial [Schizophyllum commune Tattone D]